MAANVPLQFRILDKSEGGYALTVHSSNDNDVLQVPLPIKAGTLQKRIKTLQDTFNEIVLLVGNRVTLEPSEKESILKRFAYEGNDAFADWAGTVGYPANTLIDAEIKLLPPGGIIKIISDTFALPWEILAIEPHPNQLWGLSYVIQRQMVKNGNPNTIRTERLEASTPPKIGLLAYQDNSLPAITKDEIPFFTGLHGKKLIICSLLEDLTLSKGMDAEMYKLRAFTNIRRHIYHFACEVVNDPNPARIKLLITERFPITPDDLRRHRIFFGGKPLVVLNACGTGKSDPFHTSDLVSNLLNTEIEGIVATESRMPDQFASAFIQEFYGHLLKGDEIGVALHSTRQYFLNKHNNPLGLLYSLYQVSPHWKITLRSLPTPIK